METFLALLGDGEFWLGELISFVVFVLAVSWVTSLWVARQERRAMRPYQNWKVRILAFDPDKPTEAKEYAIYPDEVRRFRQSEFEKIKFVRSVCSGTLLVKLLSMDDAKGWVVEEKHQDGGLFTVDFSKIPDGSDGMVVRWDDEKWKRHSAQRRSAAEAPGADGPSAPPEPKGVAS